MNDDSGLGAGDPRPARVLTRRRLLALGGTAAAAGAATAAVGRSGPATVSVATEGTLAAPASIAFDGVRQAGVAERAQDHLLLTAYDAVPSARTGDMASVLRAWTSIARALTAGRPTPTDNRIADGAGPAALTATVGVGGTLLDRLGVARPAELADLPVFPGDRLEPGRSGGHFVVQLCADDPLVVAAADRAFARAASGVLTVRWQQSGFQRAGSRRDGGPVRNLMGQIDGTNNVSASRTTDGGPVWHAGDGAGWMRDGTFLVVRRIRMLLDAWEDLPERAQELALGRHKPSGAPLGGKAETDPVDLTAVRADGTPLIPADSHVRLSTPNGDSEQMLRRGYSYTSVRLADGSPDQGLLFLAYVKDPRASFVPVQQRLAERDALNRFTVTTGSALFAVLPGVPGPADWLGQDLFR